jgi:malonyl-CoA/methylmalonyl-CoA synthetase
MRLLPALESDVDPRLSPRAALAFPSARLTYGELRAAAAHLAARLDGHRRIAILAEPRIETAIAVAGALLAGVPAIPVNPRSGETELRHLAADADPDLVLHAAGSDVPPALAGRPSAAVDSGIDGVLDPSPPPVDELPGARLAPDAVALIVYTSGTTGPPKGSLMPRRAIASNLDALAAVWDWSGEDVVVHGLPLFHVHGLVLGLLGPLRRGGTVRHLGRFSPDGVRDALRAGPPGATILFGVPTMYRRLAEAAEADPGLAAALTGARLLVSGSAALPATEHARLRQLTGRAVVERYGMTETLMNTAIPAGRAPVPGTVGPPVPGVQLRLLDDEGETIPATEDATIGEIHVRGPNLFVGYLNRPDATAEVLAADGWFRTGDMATWTPDGDIRLVGRRATDLIKSGGYKIGAGEIEASLREHPAVDDAAVTGEPDDDLGERIVAWVVRQPGAQVDPGELIDHVAAQLAPHKRPREVRFLADLPRNELGKVVKPRLPHRG